MWIISVLPTEEVGELARVIARTYGDQSFKKGEKPNLGEDPEVISFISRASLSSIERTTENIWDAPFILVR